MANAVIGGKMDLGLEGMVASIFGGTEGIDRAVTVSPTP